MRAAIGLTVVLLMAQTRAPDAPRQGREPDIVLRLEERWAGAAELMPLTRSTDPEVRRYAFRAVGRLRDPRVVPELLARRPPAGADLPEIADAVARSLRGFDPQSDPGLIAQAADWFLKRGGSNDPKESLPYLMPMSRIAYTTPAQVHHVEALLLQVLTDTARATVDPLPGAYATAADAIGWLARENRKTRLEDSTLQFLDRMISDPGANDTAAVRFSAMSALIAGGDVDQKTERAALADSDDDVRRLALSVLGGPGGGLPPDERLSLAIRAMNDPSPFVRYEALRAYVRRGGGATDCQPILERLDDTDSHVALEAIDATGTACPSNADATDRLAAEVTTLPARGAWNRPAHAFVALATRAPDRAAPLMDAFASHPLWWVRLYAVKAAAAMKEVSRLERLARDDNDNVRAAALKPLRQLDPENARGAILQALTRPDYELLLTAANLLKESAADETLASPLVDALLRVTAEHKDTSRDTRLALLDAIARHGNSAAGTAILPLAKDADPKVAARAASIASRLTGRTVTPDPPPAVRGWRRRIPNLDQCVQVDLSSGRGFLIEMLPQGAPVTVDHFLTLATVDHYYDGLTFHRVEPNFVVQGGSPHANERSGAPAFMRDEIAHTNARGTVGLSTRGLNTGDAQFYINLVDNRRLDDDYTVFARVSGMDAVDRIEEGEGIERIRQHACPSGLSR